TSGEGSRLRCESHSTTSRSAKAKRLASTRWAKPLSLFSASRWYVMNFLDSSLEWAVFPELATGEPRDIALLEFKVAAHG
ncbi:MAG: hypothetical protein VX193_02505, partial [Candidatus Thermoplasmatota archaeon]|nr:hypothetical protein [Candidatus Thermoplasmatota archaeon]